MAKDEKSELIEISLALPSDIEDISHVIKETWFKTYPNEEAGITLEDIEDKLKERESPAQIERYRSRILENNPNNKMFVARYNGKVIGFCGIKKEPDYNQLKSIYVLPEFQRKGIGQKLWSKFLEDITDNKNKVIVHVATYNQQAINFYKKVGFKETHRTFSDERFRMKSGSIIPETELIIERE